MEGKEKRRLENQLLVMGLKSLEDPELIEQLANLVSNWRGDRHEFLMGLLNECDTPQQRAEMYRAISPKLRFKALALAQYEAQIALRAGALVSQGKMRVEGQAPAPIIVGERKAEEEFSATLGCSKCKTRERFFGETPVAALVKARMAGWRKTLGIDEETCPKCLPVN